ncbi:MAG: nucleotide sugar dehydrogenase [Bacilli bacterium]|nr:nucleotide sugar dehydrogenase [Bacilli bacterium]
MNKDLRIALIGLGYVGLPIAISFAERGINTIGFDVNKHKIELYQQGIDPTHEVGNGKIKNTKNIIYTSDEKKLDNANFFIVAVPTPVSEDKMPDLNPVISATKIVARHLKQGDYVVYESTVYPGVTEEVCLPLLEEISGLKLNIDFKLGYSPERINPGDPVHRLNNIIKVVSGSDKEALEHIANVYSIVVDAGVHKASSIKVAEAAKVIENAQRDINIAFVNELALIFDKMGIDTKEVLEAAGTKWNFLKFTPGLVGGHCIGVDPYYLTYKAQILGYHPQVILAGRRINDGMGKFIAEKCVKKMIAQEIPIKNATVAVLGLTFKENCPDIRNSKVYDIISELKEYGINVLVTDPLADKEEAKKEYDVNLVELDNIKEVDAVIIAVSHKEYTNLSLDKIKSLYKNTHNKKVLIDVKAIINKEEAQADFDIWRL